MQTGAHADKTLTMPGQKIFVNTGTIVKSFQVAGRGELHKVVVSFEILGEDNEMMIIRNCPV